MLLAAGGTGGHLFPAQALAAELERRGRRLVFVTDRRAANYGAALAGAEIHIVRSASPAGGLFRKAQAALAILLGTLEARRILRRIKPAAAVGFGGYPSVPALLAARGLGLPTVIHEQNAVLGRANRLLAGRVRAVATAFVSTAGLAIPHERIVHTGNPVRPAIAALAQARYAPPEEGRPIALLVLGGSQGAQIFGRVVPEAVALLPEPLKARLRIVQQCRPEDLTLAENRYRAAGVAAELSRFIEDVASALEDAHLVIARAGASTVAELAAAGRPALLVPYPFAADDHQSANARALEAVGGAWLVPQPAFTAEALAQKLDRLLNAPAELARAATAARLMGRPDAAQALADLVERVARGAGPARPAPAREAAQ